MESGVLGSVIHKKYTFPAPGARNVTDIGRTGGPILDGFFFPGAQALREDPSGLVSNLLRGVEQTRETHLGGKHAMPGNRRFWAATAAFCGFVLCLEGSAMQVTCRDHQRLTAYHSPQTPGYTCWVCLWALPDGSALLSFTQATGPLVGWRQRAPQAVLARMPDAQRDIPGYDMTGLAQDNVYLRSTDRGTTWQKVSSDPFSSALNGYCVGGGIVLGNGALLRVAWGQSLTYCDVRPTGFLQRSADGGKSWGPPEYVSEDPHLQTCPTRLRRLQDGRLMLTGGAAPFDPDNWHWMALMPKIRHCLWLCKDREGRSWGPPLYVSPGAPECACEEWDWAELPGGDLLAVFRAIQYDGAGHVQGQDRRQSILTREGDAWRPEPPKMAPFPHSGHPELLRTQEGPILHIAPTGMHWTADRGATWTALNCPGSGYYPRSVQLADGTILVAAHVGNDDPYGKTDQSIVLDRFRLEVR